MKLIVISALILLGSCSGTTPIKKNNEDKEKVAPAIKKVTVPPYSPVKDYYTDLSLYKLEEGVLSKESLQPLEDRELKKIVNTDEGDPLMKMAALCNLRQYGEAYKKMLRYGKAYRQNPAFWNIMGNCYYLEGHLLKAKLYYNKALEVDENYPPAMNNIGVLYVREGRDQKALIAWQKVYKLSTFSVTPMLNLSRLYLKYAYVEKAKKMLETLANRSPSDPLIQNDLAVAYLMEGRPEKALEFYRAMDGDQLRVPSIGVNYLLALRLSGKILEAQSHLASMDERPTEKRMKEYFSRVEKFVKERER